jgi:hypothetical protein
MYRRSLRTLAYLSVEWNEVIVQPKKRKGKGVHLEATPPFNAALLLIGPSFGGHYRFVETTFRFELKVARLYKLLI